MRELIEGMRFVAFLAIFFSAIFVLHVLLLRDSDDPAQSPANFHVSDSRLVDEAAKGDRQEVFWANGNAVGR